ncbi:MAG TPA: NfeD family protein [Draconibacterium sp.]|nr:NfeD family protein [Draconibacterium sp.]
MMKKIRKYNLLLVLLFVSVAVIAQETKEKLVYKLNIKQDITKATWRQTQQAFEEADSLGADVFLIHMNTYGGTVLDADSIRTKILQSPIPVYVFIDNNAASAGALISIACDSIYMRSGGSIGAATVVNPTGQAMPDKYQSYMRSTMRATAEAHGKDTIISGNDTIYKWRRDPRIAEAMVDPAVFIEGIIDTGKVLTFTPTEAIENGYCEGIAENVPEVLKKVGIEDYKIVEYEPTWIERIIGFLVLPMISGLLIMAIIGGIYFEMQSPGIGFPLGVAILAAIAYFAPLYLEGLAAHWEILVFIVGVILVMVEIFVIPGFGVAGISGIVLIFVGLVLSLINNVNFDFEGVEIATVGVAVTTVVLGVFGGFILSLYLGNKLFTSKTGMFRNMSLRSVQNVSDGFVCVETGMFALKGKTGVSKTVLRPGGKVLIEGEVFDAVANSGFIDKDVKIIVTKVEATQLYVDKME